MKYGKQPIDIPDQMKKLQARGLIIDDAAFATRFLQNVSYYRLRAYTYPFQNNDEGADHEFIRDDIRFQDIADLYSFDEKLRILLFSAIGKIEIALRTRIAWVYAVNEGSGFWFLDSSLYQSADMAQSLIKGLEEEIRRNRKEDFITHYFEKYGEPEIPPAWMTLEVVSMGMLSKLFSALDKNNTSGREICRQFGLTQVETLRNWIYALASLRNICAHHGRVWNRRFIISPRLARRTAYPFLPTSASSRIRTNKLFVYLSIILYFQQILHPKVPFKQDLLHLLREECPRLVSLKDMGFPPHWEEYTLWRDVKA